MHIAIIGCGQLARMMALDGWRLGLTFSFLADPGENRSCVEGLGSIIEYTPNLEGEALFKALGNPDVVTVEREHVNTDMLNALTPFCSVHPNPNAVSVSQHRGREKNFLSSLGIPTAPYRLANTEESLRAGIQELGLPVLVKSCEEGYDGRGQWRINSAEQLEAMLAENDINRDLIIEGFVSFEKEVSIISARSASGQCAFYPLTENQHQNGILVSSIAPAESNASALSHEATDIALKIIETLDYVGVLSIEFFVVDNHLLVNELAPRVHNSGHWTQAAGIGCQFENHVRSIIDMPPGSTSPTTNVGMVNVLGHKMNRDWATQSNVQFHDYNKAPRPNRKLGHLNVWNTDRQQLVEQIETLKSTVYGDQQDS